MSCFIPSFRSRAGQSRCPLQLAHSHTGSSCAFALPAAQAEYQSSVSRHPCICVDRPLAFKETYYASRERQILSLEYGYEELWDDDVQPRPRVGPPALQMGAVAAIEGGAVDDVVALLTKLFWSDPAPYPRVKPVSIQARLHGPHAAFRNQVEGCCRDKNAQEMGSPVSRERLWSQRFINDCSHNEC